MKGFTLVGLLVVIAVLAMLAAVIIPNFAAFISEPVVSGDGSYVVAEQTLVVGEPESSFNWEGRCHLEVIKDGTNVILKITLEDADK